VPPPAHPHVPTAAPADDAADWLAAAEPDSARVRRWWDAAGIALFQVGRRWDAVKVDEDKARRVLATSPLPGPVMCDPDLHHCYILVPPGTSHTWSLPGTECLGVDSALKVPAPKLTAPPGPHWLQVPDATGTFVDPERLHEALREVER
jgi:hypothetical protein